MRFLALIFAVLACGMLTAAESKPTATEARAALEKWFAAAAKVKTVEAEFEQLRKLKSVRYPLRKPGRLWMDKKSGLFRWQVGNPPEMLAVRGKDGSMTVLDEKKKQARVWSKEALEAEEKKGRGHGFAMLSSMQGATLADFDKSFELAGWKQDEANPALWHFDWKFKDNKISIAVLRLAISGNLSDGTMHAFTLHMRDGSSLGTEVRSRKFNHTLPADVFRISTEGYEVERE